MLTRTLTTIVVLCSLAACQDDLTEEKASWAAANSSWAIKLAEIKKGHGALLERVAGLPQVVPAELQAERATLAKRVATGSTSLAAAEQDLAAARAKMEPLFAAGQRVPVQVALASTLDAVDGMLARASSFVSAANSDVDRLETKIEATRQTGPAAAAEPPSTRF